MIDQLPHGSGGGQCPPYRGIDRLPSAPTHSCTRSLLPMQLGGPLPGAPTCETDFTPTAIA